MLSSLCHRRHSNPALATELVRQARRHNLCGAERERLCRWGLRSPVLVASVVKCLSLLAGLSSPALDRALEADANIPVETLALARLARLAPRRALRDAWMEYSNGECERGNRAADNADAIEVMAQGAGNSGITSLGTAVAESGLLLALGAPAEAPNPLGRSARREAAFELVRREMEAGPAEAEIDDDPPPPYSEALSNQPEIPKALEALASPPRVVTLSFGGSLGTLNVQRLLDALSTAVS